MKKFTSKVETMLKKRSPFWLFFQQAYGPHFFVATNHVYGQGLPKAVRGRHLTLSSGNVMGALPTLREPFGDIQPF